MTAKEQGFVGGRVGGDIVGPYADDLPAALASDTGERGVGLADAATALVALVEGPGCLRWEDGQGFRLKDTNEWAAFYVSAKAALRAQPAGGGEVEAFVRGYKHGACHYIGGDNTEELDAAARWASEHQSDDAGVFTPPESGGQGEEACKFFSDCTSQALCASVGTCKGRFVMPASIRAEIAHPPAQASAAVTELVLAEVEKATRKFPTWPTDPLHAFAVLGEEVGELQKAILEAVYEPHKAKPGEVEKEAVQAAAMAMRFLMSLGVYEYAPGQQHSQSALAQGGGNER